MIDNRKDVAKMSKKHGQALTDTNLIREQANMGDAESHNDNYFWSENHRSK